MPIVSQQVCNALRSIVIVVVAVFFYGYTQFNDMHMTLEQFISYVVYEYLNELAF